MKTETRNLIGKYTKLKQQLVKVPSRYLEVFEYRNGLTDGVSHTQKDTGAKFNISATRIGQMEARVKYELEQLK